METSTVIQTGQQQGYSVASSRGATSGAVSSHWFNRPADQRFLSLSELRDAVAFNAEDGCEWTLAPSNLVLNAPEDPATIEDTERLSVVLQPEQRGADPIEVAPNHWSFGQIAGLCQAPASYLRKMPSQLSADCLNWSLARHRGEPIKSYATPAGGLRAVTGAGYGRIYDHEVVDAVSRIAGDGLGENGWKIPGLMDWGARTYNPHVKATRESTTLFASDRDVFIFLCDDLNPIEIGKLPSGEPDLMFRGFYVWNSEVGSKSFGIATMYLRAVCQNRILWGVEDFSEIRMRHSSGAPDRFIHEVQPSLTSFANGNTQRLIEGVTAAKAARVATDEDEALAFLRGRKFSASVSRSIYETVEREEGHPARSAWDMAQGITAVARTIDRTDARIDMERQAANLLDRAVA